MKNIILIITVFSICFSCKKSYTPIEIPCDLTQDSSLAKKYIKGTWEWVEERRVSQTGGKDIYLTPKTEGYTLKMIIADSTLSWIENSTTTKNYKYKILLWEEIYSTNSPQDKLTTLVLYNYLSGIREYQVPIKICNEFLQEQKQFVSSIAGQKTWKKI